MTREEILLQVIQLREDYNGLHFEGEDEFSYRITGTLMFTAIYQNETIEDAYQIQLMVPKSYPMKLPFIKETGGRIPPDFHTNHDGTLCLEVPIKLYTVFNENPTLLHFINKCALPYFYSYSYREKHGRLPFGEWAHGGEGLLQMYNNFFQLNDNLIVVALLKILAENNYKGSQFCPCNSGKKLLACHGPFLKEIQNLQGSKHFSVEYLQILMFLKKQNININNSLLSKSAIKKAEKLLG